MNNRDEEDSNSAESIYRDHIEDLPQDYTRINESDGEQDEDSPLIFDNIFPYKNTLPIPEVTSENISVPIIAECVICKTNIINTINFPCQHACMCVDCSRCYGKVQNICPICRTPLQSIDRIYLSYSKFTKPKKKKITRKKYSSSSKTKKLKLS